MDFGAATMDSEAAPHTKKKGKKPWAPPKVKALTEADLEKYTIFDVIMPLPGHDVSYPGGELGEKYREFLRLDGLDPDNFVRKQKYVYRLASVCPELIQICIKGIYSRRLIPEHSPQTIQSVVVYTALHRPRCSLSTVRRRQTAWV